MMTSNKTARSLHLCLTAVFFLFTAVPANAERVVPSERVQTHVSVRQEPSAQSELIGVLRIDESAELLESVPYWHKVRLDNQSVGYVSKAWTRVVTAVSAPDSVSGKTDLIIGSWNIKWFGYYGDDRHDYSRMAEIIQKMDVVAIQELRGSSFIARLDTLKAELARRGFKYDYTYSAETGYDDNPDTTKKDYLERYGFMWDIDRVGLIDPNSPYEFVHAPAVNNSVFRQVPIYVDFEVGSEAGFDFRILSIHTVFNEDLNHVRKAELEYVHNWIIDQTDSDTNPEKNIIAIGDFNANPSGQPHHFDDIITGTSDYRVLFNEPISAGENPLRTTILIKENPTAADLKKPVYDHALVSNETSYALRNDPMKRSEDDLGVVDFDQETYWQQFGTRDEVVRAMSDHRPIWFRMDYGAEDHD